MTPSAIFYCPMKPPDPGRPSGVPRIAQLFVKAMTGAGFAVDAPDLPQTYEGHGDRSAQRRLQETAIQAARRYVQDLKVRLDRPEIWLTYHCYYKSPDLIGPIVADEIGCRYAVAEGSFARSRAGGPWAAHHDAARAALTRADFLLAATARDREGLMRVARDPQSVVDFPPFVDTAEFEPKASRNGESRVRILAAGSMRDERKRQSFDRLFSAVSRLPSRSYSLTIAGDGPMRAEIEASARAQNADARFVGQLPPSAMPEFLAHGDLFAWPGVGEAYGLTYLEAQAAGLPVVAEDHGGVSACVEDGISGILTDPNVAGAFAEALRTLVGDAALRRRLSESARQWVLAERSLTAASARMRHLFGEGAA